MAMEKGPELFRMPIEDTVEKKEYSKSEVVLYDESRLPDELGTPWKLEQLPDELGTPWKLEQLPDELGALLEREHITHNPETNPEETEYQTLKAKTDQSKVTETKDIKELQAIADKAAKDYNEKYHPFERAQKKGITDVEKTSNGGVSFENSSDIYKNEKGEKAVVQIQATGSRSKDFDAANKAAGLKETPDGYVWHHRDDYDVKTNTFTLELVKEDTHNSTKPHSGGCAQYDAVHGSTYNR